MYHHGVPVAGEPQQFRELWPRGVSAGGRVREDPVQNLEVELAFFVLVQRAYVPRISLRTSSHRLRASGAYNAGRQTSLLPHRLDSQPEDHGLLLFGHIAEFPYHAARVGP